MIDVHAGDRALSIVQRRFPDVYKAPEKRTAELLSAFLKPHMKALRPRDKEKKLDYYLRFMQIFSGPRWLLVCRKIAAAFTDANIDVTDIINGVLETAFADGLNEAAYILSRGKVNAWPITVEVVSKLAAAKVIDLHKRKLKRGKDIAYNETRTQSAIHAAIYQGIMPDKLAEYVAKEFSRQRQNESIAAARAYIYSASDSGAYMAGNEAQKLGIDIEKTWLSIMDMRVRPSHKHLHGVTIPLDDMFHGYNGDLRYPHDPEAVPEETYRCRCRMVVHAKGRAPGEYSREILPTQTYEYRKWRDRQIQKAGGELELLKLHKRLGRG